MNCARDRVGGDGKIRGRGQAGQIDVAGRVQRNSKRGVFVVSAEIGRVHEVCPGGAHFGHEHVAKPAIIGGGRRSGAGKICRAGFPGQIRIALGIHRDVPGPLKGGSPKISRVNQYRINHQRTIPVIITDFKTNGLMARFDQHVASGDLAADSIYLLENNRLVLPDLAAGDAQNQISQRIQFNLFGSLETQRDLFGIGTGRDNEIIFELALIPVINQIHTRIDVLIMNPTESRHAHPPMTGIIANQIVDGCRQFRGSDHLGLVIGPHEPDVQ